MDPSQELIDALYRERVLRARAMSMEEKFLEGFRLFERECAIMKDNIRMQFPNADDDEVRRILGERLEMARKLEDGDDLYGNLPK